MIFIFLLKDGKEVRLVPWRICFHSPVSQPYFIKTEGCSSLPICCCLFAALNLGIFAPFLPVGVLAVQILLAWLLVRCVQRLQLCWKADTADRGKDGSWSSLILPTEGGVQCPQWTFVSVVFAQQTTVTFRAQIRRLIKGPPTFSPISSSSFRSWNSRGGRSSQHCSKSLTLARPQPPSPHSALLSLKPKLDSVPIISFPIRTTGFIWLTESDFAL